MSFLAPSIAGHRADDGGPLKGRSGRRVGYPRNSDRGDTLLEVLLALLVISLTSVALMSGYATTIAGSSTHQSLAGLDVALRDAAEQVTYQIQSQPYPDFTPCNNKPGGVVTAGGVVTYSPTSPLDLSGSLWYGSIGSNGPKTLDLSGIVLTAGEKLSLSGPEYWDPSTSNPPSGTWVTACPPDNQDGAQLLTLNAFGRHGVAEAVQIVVIDLAGTGA